MTIFGQHELTIRRIKATLAILKSVPPGTRETESLIAFNWSNFFQMILIVKHILLHVPRQQQSEIISKSSSYQTNEHRRKAYWIVNPDLYRVLGP